MLEITTKSGFECKIDEKVLSDWRVIKELAKLREFEDIDESTEDGDTVLDFINVMSKIEELIFKDKGKALEKHILANNDGTVAPVVLFKDIMSIFSEAKKLKNS